MTSRQRLGSRSARKLSDHANPIDPTNWAQVDEKALPEERRLMFLKRKKAIELYLRGSSDALLRKKTGLSRKNVYRIISTRCLLDNPDGQLNGWRGALPFFRVVEYTRVVKPDLLQTGRGGAGSLKWLFSSPIGRDLERDFTKKILKIESSLAHQKQPFQHVFKWFIDELRALGLETKGEWPFTSATLGYETIRRHVKKFLEQHPQVRLQQAGGPDAIQKSKASDGTQRPQFRLFDRVECDAHKLDSRMVVMVPSPSGGYESRLIHRLWVIVVIEVCTRAVLGYHLSMRRECSAEDVLSAVKKALTLWTPRKIQFTDDGYNEGAAFPSSISSDFVGACWNEFSVDGALANICKRVEKPMEEVVGAKILKPQDKNSFSSRRSKDDRPFIETFFRELGSRSLHRLSTTTGSSFRDKKGRKPDEIAIDIQFQIEYAEELLDVIIANYNARPHTSLGYRSPLSQMSFLASTQRARIRHAEPDQIRKIVGLRKLCTLLGGEYTGNRPYFNFSNARYSAEWLTKRPDLIGKQLWLQIDNELDARWAHVSDSKGQFLGAVRALPPWHLTPHTLYMRQSIRDLQKKKLIHLTSNSDAIEELINYQESSRDKKLPIHPAYLEARRIMRLTSEALIDMRHEIPKEDDESTRVASNQLKENDVLKMESANKNVLILPAMQKAKTW